MNKAFMETLYKNLIINDDCTPVTDEKGEILYGEEIKFLVKRKAGTFIFLELLNGDNLTAEQIKMRLQETKNRLLSMESNENHYVAQLFIFSESPDLAKIEAIKSSQINEFSGNKILECMSVNIKGKEFITHAKAAVKLLKIDRTIKSMFESANYENVSYDEIREIMNERNQELRLSFRANKPVVTYFLIAANILVWLAAKLYSIKSGVDATEFQVYLGAKININILNGEYWRFVTPMFLHAGITHLVLNCYSLYSLGVTVERIYGHLKFIAIYFIAGVLGNLLSFIFSPNSAVGASGAIFGLLGAILYFGLEKPKIFKRYFGFNIVSALVINLVYGFSNSRIDNFGHIGGLIGGFLASGIVKVTNITRWYMNRALFIIITLVLSFSGVFYGFNSGQSKILRRVYDLDQSVKTSNWVETEKIAEEILLKKPDRNTAVSVYWSLIGAEAANQKLDEAMAHVEELKKIEPKVGYYLSGAIYYDIGEYEKAKQELLNAREQKSDYNIDKDIEALLKILE